MKCQQKDEEVLTENNNDSLLMQAIKNTDQDGVSFKAIVMNDGLFEKAMKVAEFMTQGGVTVPAHLKGNFGDCFAIAMQALCWGMNPWPVAQKTHLINGVLAYEAQLVNAVISSSGAIEGRFHYRFSEGWSRLAGKARMQKIEKNGKNGKYTVEVPVAGWSAEDEAGLWVDVGAVIAGETEMQWLPEPLYLSGVTTRNSPLWVTKPDQQACYLAVKYWARLYAPAAILGVYSADEIPEQRHEFAETGLAPKPQQQSSAIRRPVADQQPVAQEAQPAALPFIPVDELIRDLQAATTYEALDEVVPKITANLTDKEELSEARAAYRARRAEMDAEAANQNQSNE